MYSVNRNLNLELDSNPIETRKWNLASSIFDIFKKTTKKPFSLTYFFSILVHFLIIFQKYPIMIKYDEVLRTMYITQQIQNKKPANQFKNWIKKTRLHHAPLIFFTENTTHQTTYLMVMHTFMRVSHDKIEERNLSTPMHPFPIYSYHQESL